MKLGFHYHIGAIEEGGQIYMPGYLGLFIDSLAAECAEVVCFLHTPRAEERRLMDYALQAKNVRLVGCGPRRSVPLRTLLAAGHTRPLRNEARNLDALLVRGPSPLLPQMVKAAGKTPTALLLVGDYLAGIDDLPQPKWRKELIRLWSTWNSRRQMAAARQSLTFVNSQKLYRQLQAEVPRLMEMRTTTLGQEDFYARADTCQEKPVRLLYTGRLNRAKGLLEMVEVLARLLQKGLDVRLEMAGWAEKGDNILEEIARRARDLGIGERVQYLGYKTVGPELFACYHSADIYLIASKSDSEGFPRTIWEAMAHSLPVVATRVGSIPDFIEGAAELVEPSDPQGLAVAIHKLIQSPERRQELIRRGMELARQNTL